MDSPRCPHCDTALADALGPGDCCHGAEADALRAEIRRLRALVAAALERVEVLPSEDGGEAEAILREAEPNFGRRAMSVREWTLRICPSCGATKADAAEFTVCSGPHCGPFLTDHSHKPTVTDVVVVQEAEPILRLATVTDEYLRQQAGRAAHDAYYAHNESCGCRTVEHLTAFVADAVLAALGLPVAEQTR